MQMRRTGYFTQRTTHSGQDDGDTYYQYLVPYVDSHIERICQMIQVKVRQRLGFYYGLSQPGRIQLEILKDVLETVQEHMASVSGVPRGAGLGSLFTRLFTWLAPRISSLVSLVPPSVKTAAAEAATSLAVQGINLASEKASTMLHNRFGVERERGSGFQSGLQNCFNAAMRTLTEHDERGGFIGPLISGIMALAPSVIGLITGATQRGAGFGAYWKQQYSFPGSDRGAASTSGTRSRKRKAPAKTKIKQEPEEIEPIAIFPEPQGPYTTPCTISVMPEKRGRKNPGGRPVKRSAYCNRADLDMLN